MRDDQPGPWLTPEQVARYARLDLERLAREYAHERARLSAARDGNDTSYRDLMPELANAMPANSTQYAAQVGVVAADAWWNAVDTCIQVLENQGIASAMLWLYEQRRKCRATADAMCALSMHGGELM